MTLQLWRAPPGSRSQRIAYDALAWQ